jgi:hypothetical protein
MTISSGAWAVTFKQTDRRLDMSERSGICCDDLNVAIGLLVEHGLWASEGA